jgi:hypothetical protein
MALRSIPTVGILTVRIRQINCRIRKNRRYSNLVEAPAFSRHREDFLDDEGFKSSRRVSPPILKPETLYLPRAVFANFGGRTREEAKENAAVCALSTTAFWPMKKYGC